MSGTYGKWSKDNLRIIDPHAGEIPCCFCGTTGWMWTGTDELGQRGVPRHWPRGWHYNHTCYGYGEGTHLL